MPSDHEQSSLMDHYDKKLLLEDQEKSIASLSMQVANISLN